MTRQAQYIAAWRDRLHRESQLRQSDRADALQIARTCAEYLVTQFGVRRVYLIGSLLPDGLFHSRSDIDLVVEGLPPERYVRALADISSLSDRDIDLIPMEDASPEMLAHVRTCGRVLYERSAISASEI